MGILVCAAPGRTVVFPPSVLPAPGRRPTILRPGETCVVSPSDPFVVRRLACGDLLSVNEGSE